MQRAPRSWRRRRHRPGPHSRLRLSVLDQGYSNEMAAVTSFRGPEPSRGVAEQFARRARTLDSVYRDEMPLVLRPGSAEPWRRIAIIQALMRPDPGEAFNYLPSAHAGLANRARCGRSISSATSRGRRVCRRSRIELHGPGYSSCSSAPIALGVAAGDRGHVEIDRGQRRQIVRERSGVWTRPVAANRRSARRPPLDHRARASDDPQPTRAVFDRNVASGSTIRSRRGSPARRRGCERTARKGPRLSNGRQHLPPADDCSLHVVGASLPTANSVPVRRAWTCRPTKWRPFRLPGSQHCADGPDRRSAVLDRLLRSDLVGRLKSADSDKHHRVGSAARGESVRSLSE